MRIPGRAYIVYGEALIEVLDGDEVELDLGAERAMAVVGLGVRENVPDRILGPGIRVAKSLPPGILVAGLKNNMCRMLDIYTYMQQINIVR